MLRIHKLVSGKEESANDAQTAVSTGLFRSDVTQMTKENIEFQINSELMQLNNITAEIFRRFTTAGGEAYYGIHTYGLKYPSGTSDDIVVPTFEILAQSEKASDFIVPMEAMKTELNCEAVPVHNITVTKGPTGFRYVDIDIDIPQCSLKQVRVASEEPPSPYKPSAPGPKQSYRDFYQQVSCRDSSNNTTRRSHVLLVVADTRFLLTEQGQDTSSDYYYVDKMTSVLCKPDHYIDVFDVRPPRQVDGAAQAVLSAKVQPNRRHLEGHSLEVMIKAVSMNEWNMDYPVTNDFFFKLMAARAGT